MIRKNSLDQKECWNLSHVAFSFDYGPRVFEMKTINALTENLVIMPAPVILRFHFIPT